MTQLYALLRDEALKKAGSVAPEIVEGIRKQDPEKCIDLKA